MKNLFRVSLDDLRRNGRETASKALSTHHFGKIVDMSTFCLQFLNTLLLFLIILVILGVTGGWYYGGEKAS